jgi:RHS repeat-associated protein
MTLRKKARTRKWFTVMAAIIGIAALFPALAVGAVNQGPAAENFGLVPTLAAELRTTHLAEPLVRTAATTPAEDQALAQALADYSTRANPQDFSSLADFASAHPQSGWTPALLTDLGLSYLHDGFFSQAIKSWQQAWLLGKDATDPRAKAVVDRAVGELAQLYSSLGQFDQLRALLDQMGNRPITGSSTESLQNSVDKLSLVKKDPRHLFNCGPLALKYLMLAMDAHDTKGRDLQWYHAGPNGTNLAELAGLADKAKFKYKLISRKPGQAVPVPAIVHWKVGHFAAIVGKANGRYHVEDPVFPGMGMWVTQAALDAEASGDYMIPASKPVAAGWHALTLTQAGEVWGKGPTSGTQKGDNNDPCSSGASCSCPGGGSPMCGYNIKEATVGITMSDTPVGYAPPIGPSAKVTITYNQREDSQPAVFSFYNVSPKWTLNWLEYVTDDPTAPGATVSRYLAGGGAYYYSGYNSGTGQFAAQNDDGSTLVLVSQSPVVYKRLLRDGRTELYTQSDGSTSYPRNVFLSQVIDPQGNAVTLNYDAEQRLTSLTDAAGRTTTFSYGVATEPLLVTQITDPFGRSAVLTYDLGGRLSSITDIIGITSRFTYDGNSLVNSLTTPYGTTSFSYTAPGTSAPPRFVDVTDPLGNHEREEWLEPAPIPDSDPAATVPTGMPVPLVNQYLTDRDSFHWDKNQYILAGCTPTGGCDYTKARDKHFAHVPGTDLKSTTVESLKNPLENRIWYNYPGQTEAYFAGTSDQPIAIGRVLDDGTTQLSLASYDTSGLFNPTQKIDPIGRTTSFGYGNQIDLATISQTTAYGFQTTLAQYTYNIVHRPIFSTDAAGQTTSYAYNAAGQRISVTDPLGEKTSYHYNGTGDLTSITNANGVTAATYTYDAFDRIATYTDSEGWQVSYNYDNADRVTKITYSDGTADTYTYNKLDLASHTDRLSRVWAYTHDGDRRLTAMTDPTAHQTLYGYNPAGQLTSLTDPRGNVTQWAYDLEGRPTTKTYPDSSTATTTYENTTSRVHSVTDALGQVKTFTYAQDDRPTAIAYTAVVNPTPNVAFTYDPYFPRITSMTDGTGTTNYAYVPVGSLGALQTQTESAPFGGGTISYSYDALGRGNARTVQGAGAETLAYDAIGRITNHSSDLGSFTLSYLGQTGQVTARALSGSSLATTWSYLPNSGDRRLSGVSTTGLSAGQYTTFAYTSNAANQTTGTTQTSDASIPYPSSALSQTASYNNLNQLTNLSGQAYTYDANGNLVSDGVRTYAWDAENRLVGITYPGVSGKATGFVYDGQGRRISISSTPAGGGSTTTTSYVWCGSRPCQARNAANAVIKEFDAEGEFAPGSPGTSYFYAPDQLGSVRRVFTTSATPTYDYDPYGVTLRTTAPVTDFNYAKTFYNSDSGLYLTQYRQYAPNAGRWLSRDPLGEASDQLGNLYAYVGGNPINRMDPLGLLLTPPDPLPPSSPIAPPAPDGGACAPNDQPNGDGQQYAGSPVTGEPGTWGQYGTTDRYFGPDGNAAYDIDSHSDHGAGIPHLHSWYGGVRGGPVPLPSGTFGKP